MYIKSFLIVSVLALFFFKVDASNSNEELKKSLEEYIENQNVAPFEGIRITYHKPWSIRNEIKNLEFLLNLKQDLKSTANNTILMNIQSYINHSHNSAEKIKLHLAKLGIVVSSNSEIFSKSNEGSDLDNIFYAKIKTGKEKDVLEKEDILFKDLYEENSDTFTKEFLLNLSCHALLENMSFQLTAFATKTLGKRTIKINSFNQNNFKILEEVNMFKTSEMELNAVLTLNFPANFDKLDKENLLIYVEYAKKIGEKYRKKFLCTNLEKIGLFSRFNEIEKADEEHGYLRVSSRKVDDSLEGLQKEFDFHTVLARLYYVLTRNSLTTDEHNEERFKYLLQKHKESLQRDDIQTKIANSFREQLNESKKSFGILTQENNSLKFSLEKTKEEVKKVKNELHETTQKLKKKSGNQSNSNNNGLSQQLMNELNLLRQNSQQWNQEKLKLEQEINLLKENINFQKKQTFQETKKINEELSQEKKKTEVLEQKIRSLEEELRNHKEKKVIVYKRSEKDKKLFNELNKQVNTLKKDLEEQGNKKIADEKEIRNLKILLLQMEEEKLEAKKQTESQLLEKDKEIDLLKQQFIDMEEKKKEFENKYNQFSMLALEKAMKISNLNDNVSRLEKINIELQNENQDLQKNLKWWENWNPYENSDPMYSSPQPYYPPQQQFNYHNDNQQYYNNVPPQWEQIQQNYVNGGENNNQQPQKKKKKKKKVYVKRKDDTPEIKENK